MEELVQLIVKTYGIVGIILLTPTVGCVFLWRHYIHKERLHSESEKQWSEKIEQLGKGHSEKIESLQQKRIDDVKALSDAVQKIATEQSGMNRETNMLMERINETLQAVISTR